MQHVPQDTDIVKLDLIFIALTNVWTGFDLGDAGHTAEEPCWHFFHEIIPICSPINPWSCEVTLKSTAAAWLVI